MPAVDSEPDLWVVIPAYNEAGYITDCLDSFTGQSDDCFHILVVDNNSTDMTAKVARRWATANPSISIRVITETTKGTGWACKQGFDYAIAHGAETIARTDADCLVGPCWVEAIRQGLRTRDFLYGRLKMRRDEDSSTSLWLSAILSYKIMIAGTFVARVLSRNFKKHRGLAAGANMAIRSSLYTRIGGFKGSTIDDFNEDHDLNDRVYRATRNVDHPKPMLVYTSLRRFKHHGLRKKLRWYMHKGTVWQEHVDVR